MKPLAYLTLKSLLNGGRRALTSARRLIGLIVAIGYYVFFFIRPFERPSRTSARGFEEMQLQAPPLEVLHSIVFAVFALFTLILALGTFSPRASFRPADVDVLFATPVSPRVVLVFRIVRDYLLTLLFPLLLAVLSWRPMMSGLDMLFANMPSPDTKGYVYRSWTIAWFLMSLCWVSIGYAASLFVSRSDLNSDRNRKIITVGSAVLLLAISGYITYQWRMADTWPDRLALTYDPLVRAVFFTGSFATMMVMGPLQGNLLMTLGGALSLVAIIVGALALAMTQVGWLYDQAAARGFDTMRIRTLHRQGDMHAVLAEQARLGKLKAGKRRWLSRINVQGPAAILWREIAQQSRGLWGMVLLLALLGVFMSVIPVLLSDDDLGGVGFGFLAMQGVAAFTMAMGVGQSGFIELLRRVDLEKPLPFSPAVIALYEIIAKSMPSTAAAGVGAVAAFIVQPSLWIFVLSSFLLIPSLSVLFSSALFLVTVLFPDVEDPTQRGFRGLMTILTIAILVAPVVIAFSTLAFLFQGFAIGVMISAVVASGLAIGLTVLAAWIGGGLYASYNPSE